MRRNQLWLLLCSGLLACSGRYVSNSHEGVGAETGVDAGAASATGGKGGQGVVQPPGGSASTSVAGATSTAGSGEVVGTPPQTVTETACGVPLGQPAAISEPINDAMLWWVRLSRLIWGDRGQAVPPSWSSPISYEQSGRIADEAIDRAIVETKGIPGVERFVRRWLQLEGPEVALVADWNSVLSQGPALDLLLNVHFDTNRVGALTEPAFLIARPSISWRGTVMLEALFAQSVPREPPGIAPFVPPAGLTRREGLAQAVSSPACAACHSLVDPLGFSLEHYDPLGNYVSFDAGKAVDASGSVRLPSSGGELEFVDIEDLARQLPTTCDANLGLADQFLSFALEQPGAANPTLEGYELDRARMRQAFLRSGRTYRSLIKAFAQGPAIRKN